MNLFPKGVLSQAAKAVRGSIYPAKISPSRIDGLGGGRVAGKGFLNRLEKGRKKDDKA